MSYVKFEHVGKRYSPDDDPAVSDFTLDVNEGEFLVLVGPSGCGKSTTLRMLAGLEDITSGNISIDGVRVNDLPPNARGVGMVFQSYALYPHMTVERNLSFGLRMARGADRLPNAEIDARVAEAAAVLGLEPYLDRLPRNLSGGQRQRVALGRALVRRPKVLLMDEPLSNLDAKLRNQMRVELRRIHDELGTTTVYVTHDQVEAMTLADRIAVMDQGYLQQHATPMEAYHHPSNTFVASFLGRPPMNLVHGTCEAGAFRTSCGTLEVVLPHHAAGHAGPATLGVRPEDVTLDAAEGTDLHVKDAERLGAETIVHLAGGDVHLAAVWHRPGMDADATLTQRGATVRVQVPTDSVRLFDADGAAVGVSLDHVAANAAPEPVSLSKGEEE
jgi:ABC-type sugar transport system ATPase subunit